MKKTQYAVKQICEDVADQLRGFAVDIPMIREAINDRADFLDKEGYRVNFNFNQILAVRRVCRAMKHRAY